MATKVQQIEEIVDERVGEVRTDSLDMSFGEIISLISNKELFIQPDFQRYFRWSEGQSSRLIESILLRLPVPQIFVIETTDNVLELIDGLQRISSVVKFLEPTLLGEDVKHLRLIDCDLIPQLNGKLFSELPLATRLRIKRTPIRVVIIKKQNTPFLQYMMFKRLNTGGAELSAQEIRNCTARMAGEEGVLFYEFLKEMAKDEDFAACTESLAESERMQRGDEELVLRFFAIKNAHELFKGNIRDWLDNYMESVILKKRFFVYTDEKSEFKLLFAYLKRSLGAGAFVRYRDNQPIGGLAPAYFEAVTMGVWRFLNQAGQSMLGNDSHLSIVKDTVIETLQTQDFRANVGPSANTLSKMKKRISIVHDALAKLLK